MNFQVIDKAKQAAAGRGVQVSRPGIDHLHPIEAQNHGHQLLKAGARLGQGPAGAGAVGWGITGRQVVLLQPEVGGHRAGQMQQGGLGRRPGQRLG